MIMQLIDIGVNLMSPSFNHDREAALADAAAAGVSPLIMTGSSFESSAAAIGFAETHAGKCYATAGIHPHNARSWKQDSAAALKALVLRGAAVALGECGLDYNRNFSPPADQRRCFEDQLALAAELKKPVFLHERDACDDFSAILHKRRKELPGAVVHCFTGSMKELERYLELDCYIGITGWICDERRGSHLIPLVKHIPADRLLLETDAPYLLPRNLEAAVTQHSTGKSTGKRGRSGRNEPRFLPHIAAFIARALGKEPEQLAAETYANTVRFFGLGD